METEQINGDNNAPIIIEVKLAIDRNPHGIPPGTLMDIRITIIDEYETIRTSNANFTMDLCKVEKLKPSAPGTIAKYSQRLQKTIIKFPGLKKEEIAKIVGEDLKKLPVRS